MAIPFVLCDVFADRQFAGNQLAVVLGKVTDEAMLPLAREFGWSEITFVSRPPPGSPPSVRIWTPDGELPFAGHPTIGTTVVLASEGWLDLGPAVLRLGIGDVDVEVQEQGPDGGRAGMSQRPSEFGEIIEDRTAMAGALALGESDLVPELPIQIVSTGLPHLLVPVRTLAALEGAEAQPELRAIAGPHGLRWAYLFTTDTPGTTAAARARLIAPGFEDPATGSAAGPLGAYLVHYGLHRAGVLEIEQGMEIGRPSRIEVDVPVLGGDIGAVKVSGRVHIWGRGQLYPRI